VYALVNEGGREDGGGGRDGGMEGEREGIYELSVLMFVNFLIFYTRNVFYE